MTRPIDMHTFKASGKSLFDIQPEYCRQKIEPVPIDDTYLKPHVKRVLFFDPSLIYNKINDRGLRNPFLRISSVSITSIFSKIEGGFCSCGCGIELSGRKSRWASDSCKLFANAIFNIIAGNTQTLRLYRSRLIGGIKCEVCGVQDDLGNPIELDHLYPVKFGGGGGWISNYQFKCRRCHREKTNNDFGFKSKK